MFLVLFVIFNIFLLLSTYALYIYIYIKFKSIFQEVAVKILMEQDFHAERYKEFLREVCTG